MISFDASFRLRLSSGHTGRRKGVNEMSDEWVAKTVKRIKQSEEEKRQKENYELHRESKISSHEDKLFAELQAILKENIAKLNEHFPETQKQFEIKTRYDEIEIKGPRELSFDVKQESDNKHELTLTLWQGTNREPSYEKIVTLDLNQDGEVRYVQEGRPTSVRQLAESLLEVLINFSL